MHTEKIIPIKELLPLLMAIFVDILGFGLVYPVLTAMPGTGVAFQGAYIYFSNVAL